SRGHVMSSEVETSLKTTFQLCHGIESVASSTSSAKLQPPTPLRFARNDVVGKLIEPALRIFLVVQRNSLLGKLKRVLGVEHHRHFFSSGCILARHNRTGMRAVRNPARMQRDGSWLNPATRPEIAAHVKQHFVGLNVIVHPWNPDSLWMRIEHARCKCANDIA